MKWGLSQKIAIELCGIIMFLSFVGGRAFHVLFEHPDYYFKVPSQIFKFWQGGFVLYGGVLFAVLGSVFYLNWKKQQIRIWMDVFTPVVVVGYIFGRFANLLSGSGYGQPTEMPWAIVYPLNPEAPAGIPLHPTPIYSMIWNSLFFLVWTILKKYKKLNQPGQVLALYGIYHGVGRFIIESFRGDFRGTEWLGLSLSSWFSLALMSFCAYLYLSYRKSPPLIS
jgi:phosphatidylglycerol:prolipoprotein diacylglycerol transferase